MENQFQSANIQYYNIHVIKFWVIVIKLSLVLSGILCLHSCNQDYNVHIFK